MQRNNSKTPVCAGTPREKSEMTLLQQSVYDVILTTATNFTEDQRRVLHLVLWNLPYQRLERVHQLQSSIPEELNEAWRFWSYRLFDFAPMYEGSDDWRINFISLMASEEQRLKVTVVPIKAKQSLEKKEMEAKKEKILIKPLVYRKPPTFKSSSHNEKPMAKLMKKTIQMFKKIGR